MIKELRRELEVVSKSKCKPLSEQGVSRQETEAKLPELKKQLLAAIDQMAATMSGLGGMTGDKDAKDQMSSMVESMFGPQKKAISDLTADQIFQIYQLEVKVPTLETVKKSEDLDKEIEQFVFLSTK